MNPSQIEEFDAAAKRPFDLDLIFAPDGVETFAEAWARQVVVDGFRVCSLDDTMSVKKLQDAKKT